jgi:hypothetical protein
MVWFFERDRLVARVETTYDRVAGEFVLVIEKSQGWREIERFADHTAFQRRLQDGQHQLQFERWKCSGTDFSG